MAGNHHRTDGVQDAGPETPGQISDDRDRVGDDRDQTSVARDNRAVARDDRAVARDDRAEARDDRAEARDETVREGAASDRAQALRDRWGAASDRKHAAADRKAASSDRVVSAGERAVSSIDGLTGAHRRDAGIVELERETARAKRTGQPFVLGFVDVDGLKATNDSLGHAAGDQLLRQIVDTIRANLRFYDLIVRFGGDEFLCGLLDLKMKEAAKRFLLVNADLAETQQASVTVGLAELKGDDSLKDLIMRADEALYRDRQQRPSAHAGRWLRSVR
jgi:diguanylate cyclase (GGDEF)-like protein